MKTIWFDLTNTPHVHFQLSLYRQLQKRGYNFTFTARDFSETVPLLEKNLDHYFRVIGKYHGKSNIKKILGLLIRFFQLSLSNVKFDVSISNGSEAAIWLATLKGKKTIAFGDNDQAKQWTYGKFVDYAFFPKYVEPELLYTQGIRKEKLYQYDGYKEDIYIADYTPDPNFLSSIPFVKYILLRPENLQANYAQNNTPGSIVPKLVELLSENNYNVVYLPRYEIDHDYVGKSGNIYIPDKPINGLDACYYAGAVLTGAGTLAREAACLGVPAISFYSGKQLLAVDKSLIDRGWIIHSRDPQVIVNSIDWMPRRENRRDKSQRIRNEVVNKLIEVIEG